MTKLSILAVILLSLISLNLSAGVEIYLKKTVVISGDSVSLGDISSIKGASSIKRDLQNIVIARFSPGEKVKTIGYAFIQKMVNQLFKGELYLIGSGVQVKRSFFFFSEDEIKKQVLKYLQSKIDDSEFVIEIISKEKELFSHHKNDSLQIATEPGNKEKDRLILTVKTENSSSSLRVSCKLRRLQAVVVAKRDISLTTKLTIADYEIKKILVKDLPAGYIEKIKAGSIALFDIKVGDVITVDVIRTPLLIKYGDIVTVIFQEGGVSIQMRAKAIKAGRAGDIIELENTITYKKFYGKIDSKGSVLVGLEGN